MVKILFGFAATMVVLWLVLMIVYVFNLDTKIAALFKGREDL